MSDARFRDDGNSAAEFCITFFKDRGVLGDGYDIVSVTDDVEQRNIGLGQGIQIVDGVSAEGKRLDFGESVGFETLRPIRRRSLAHCLAPWPAFYIEDGGISVDAGDFAGICDGPVVDDESAPAHAFECRFVAESVLFGEVGVEFVPARDGFGVAEECADFSVDDVESMIEEGDVGLGFVSPESRSPYPGITGGGFFWTDDFAWAIIQVEFVKCVAVPVGRGAREGAVVGKSREKT